MLQEKQQLVQDLILPLSIYMYSSYTYTVMCILRFDNWINLDSSGSASVSFRPLGSYSSTPRAVCVCMRVYTHIHPHTLQPPTYTAVKQIGEKKSQSANLIWSQIRAWHIADNQNNVNPSLVVKIKENITKSVPERPSLVLRIQKCVSDGPTRLWESNRCSEINPTLS